MTPPHQCMAQAEEWCQFSHFPPPVLPWSAGSPWRWAEELATAPKRNHFLLTALCLAELLLIISAFLFLLSLFGQVTDTHSPLCFLPWHAEEVKTAEKGLLLTCHWVFLSSFLGQIKLLNEEPYFGKANTLLSQAWLWIPKCSLDTILYSFLFEMHFNLLFTQQKNRN